MSFSTRLCAVLLASAALAGCTQSASDQQPEATVVTDTVPLVPARVETRVTTDATVDADDPALWADANDPSRALWFGTDKSDGLYVHAMDGTVKQFFPDGPMNNVDLREGFVVDGKPQVLVAASEREKFGIMTWLLDPATLEVRRYGFLPTGREAGGFGEPYGFCMGLVNGEYLALVNNKDGEARVFAITAGPNGPTMEQRHRFKVGSQTEGCVVDDANGHFYLGEEDVAIWRFDLAAPETPPVQIATADGTRLVDDIEGLTLMRDKAADGTDRTFLIASSQGDNAFGVFRLVQDQMPQWVGRFRVGGGTIDPVTETDGLSAWSGPIGAYSEGAIAMHDHCDSDTAEDPAESVCDGDSKQQNYKLVDWRDVKAALGLDR
ncbi:MAG: phytase [Sphingomonadaceae bacterium]